jgi:hypothetical protein
MGKEKSWKSTEKNVKQNKHFKYCLNYKKYLKTNLLENHNECLDVITSHALYIFRLWSVLSLHPTILSLHPTQNKSEQSNKL